MRKVGKALKMPILLFLMLALSLTPSLSNFSGLEHASADGRIATLQSKSLRVQVDKQFPRVIRYTWRSNGDVLYGQDDELTKVRINGKDYEPTVTSEVDGNTAVYHMEFSKIDVNMDVQIKVTDNVLSLKVTKITENGSTKVQTLAIPNHSLVSVRSNQSNAQLSHARLPFDGSYGKHEPIDQFEKISSLSTGEEPSGTTMGILNTAKLAAAISTNSLGDQKRLLYKTTDEGDYKATGLWSGKWTYRGANGEVVALPYEKVVVTGDQNGDEKVGWQDGAIAFRSVMYLPKGSKAIKNNVVNQISFNIASQPTHPFLRTLDEIKKSYLYTDGLGQSILLKGYQDQGHDSAHPDYGSHYNKAAGGLKDLKFLVQHANKYNARIGVHINQQEMYPEAHNFRWKLARFNSQGEVVRGWQWMDQSYQINQHKDVTKGFFQDRLRELKKDVPNLDWIYVDVYFDRGWDAYEVAHTIQSLGWGVHTEFEDYMWPNALYYHRANQYDQIGVNSKMLRFAYNQYKDVWVKQGAMLMGDGNLSFMGWMGQNSINKWLESTFTQNLPTKYMQHFPIMKWTEHRIDFKGDVYVTDKSGHRQIFKDGKLVMDGGNIFLPWNPYKETKIYHWNSSGGTTTWELPDSWAKENKVVLYQLTDTGKNFVKKLSTRDGKVTIEAEKDTPYVIYPHPAKKNGHTKNGKHPDIDWGAGSYVEDPHFFSNSLKHWQVSSKTGDVSGISVITDKRGYQDLQFAGPKEGRVSQQIDGLEPGSTYSASVWVQISGGKRKAIIGVKDYGGPEVTNWADMSPAVQYTQANPRRYTHFQRMKVLFTVPEGHHSATLYLKAAAGDPDAKVRFADVRVVKNNGGKVYHQNGHYYYQDFENVDQGWGPFVYARESGDPSIHLSELHKGYTRDTISGQFSLKVLDPGPGMQYRTLPHTLRLKPNHAYRIRFDYQSDAANLFNFVIRSDKDGSMIVKDPLAKTADRPLDSPPPKTLPTPEGWNDVLPPQHSAPHRTYTETFTTGRSNCGEYFIAVTSPGGGGALTIDNLAVDDLGPVKASAQCPSDPAAELELQADELSAGETARVTGTFTNHSKKVEKNVRVQLKVPEEWTIEAASPTSFTKVEPGESVTVTWDITPNKDAETEAYVLAAKAEFTWDGHQSAITTTQTVNILPPLPEGTMWLSDLDWVKASNGWGPVELDMSNGGRGSGDGHTLTINGETYQKGIGAHAPSEILYYIGGNYSRFTAEVGVDDEMSPYSAASIVFQVWGDGEKLYDSGVMTGSDDAKIVDINIEGVDKLKLVITTSGNGNGSDHGDWGAAKIIQ